MKKLTINQLKKIERWSYRLIFVFMGLALISLTIPKNICSVVHIGPFAGLQCFLAWGFILLEIISGIITIYALIKVSLLEKEIKKESR